MLLTLGEFEGVLEGVLVVLGVEVADLEGVLEGEGVGEEEA